MSNVAIVEGYGFKVDTWEDFRSTRYLPDGLIGRAEMSMKAEQEAGCEVTHVLYDPTEEHKDLLVLGSDPEAMAGDLMAAKGIVPVVNGR